MSNELCIGLPLHSIMEPNWNNTSCHTIPPPHAKWKHWSASSRSCIQPATRVGWYEVSSIHLLFSYRNGPYSCCLEAGTARRSCRRSATHGLTTVKNWLTTNPVPAIITAWTGFFMDTNMTPTSFVIQLPRQRRRAVELYSRDTPFRGRVEQSRVRYQRRPKHVNQRHEQWKNSSPHSPCHNTSWWWWFIW